MKQMGVYVEYWKDDRLYEMEIMRLTKEEWERLFRYGIDTSDVAAGAFGVNVIDMTPLDTTRVDRVRILFRTFDIGPGGFTAAGVDPL